MIIGDKLGAGYFAEVRFALDRKNGEDVAVKIIDKLKCRGKENMIEAEIRNDSSSTFLAELGTFYICYSYPVGCNIKPALNH